MAASAAVNSEVNRIMLVIFYLSLGRLLKNFQFWLQFV
jgi:hypothetical protein